MDKITKDWTIGRVLQEAPQAEEIFKKYGIDCVGCAAASMETVAFGALMHGFDADELVKELNEKMPAAPEGETA